MTGQPSMQQIPPQAIMIMRPMMLTGAAEPTVSPPKSAPPVCIFFKTISLSDAN